MPSLNELNINDIDYDLEDSVARQSIESINTNITTLSSNLGTAESNINNLQTDIGELQSDIGDTNTLINNLSDDIDDNKNAFLGINSFYGANNLARNVNYDYEYIVTNNGVKFEINKDGSVKATGVNTGAGVSELMLSYRVMEDGRFPNYLNANTYIGFGCPSGGSDSTYAIYFDYTNAAGTIRREGRCYGDAVEVVIPDKKCIQIVVHIGTNYDCGDGVVFYPALVLKEAYDHIFSDEELYKRYQLTNEEIDTI